MSNLLVDEIQQLSDCRSHGERADWLLTAPLSILARYEMTIRNRLLIAGFREGVDYLEWELARFRARRRDGEMPWTNEHTRVVMFGWSIGDYQEPCIAGADAPKPDPDHSLTDI